MKNLLPSNERPQTLDFVYLLFYFRKYACVLKSVLNLAEVGTLRIERKFNPNDCGTVLLARR